MKLTMQQIVGFPSLFEKIKNKPLPFKTSYNLMLLAQEIEKHYNFYQEKLQEIIAKYGQRDQDGNLVVTDDGQGIKLVEETKDEAREKISELRNLEVEISDIKFSIEDFDGVELSPEEMIALMPFMVK